MMDGMNTKTDKGFFGQLERLVGSWSSRFLVYLVGGLFVLDLLIPDPIPYLDEAVLALATILLARWRSRQKTDPVGSAPKPPPKNVTPTRED